MALISPADALAAHNAIHSEVGEVKLSIGNKKVEKKNGMRCVQLTADIKAMEQNKSKSSAWAKQAKEGAKITWFLKGPSHHHWGRIVEGVIEARGKALAEGDAPAAPAAKKRPAAAALVETEDAEDAEMEDAEEEAAPAEPPAKKAKAKAAPPPAAAAAASAAPATTTTTATTTATTTPAASSSSTPAPGSNGDDKLGLAALFAGGGYGSVWEPVLRPVIERLPDAAKYIGPGRNKRIVPVREMTLQALKPNPPSNWRVVSFGQSPFPRLESATGIAHFDNAVKEWTDSRFGSCVTMRCIIKAAAMYKYGIEKSTPTADLRALLKEKKVVPPAEWFTALLTQGVLFMNAACTLLPPEDKADRAGNAVREHAKFWLPVIEAVVDAILAECKKANKGIVFAWWGSESLATKKLLKNLFAKYSDVKVEHIDHNNPAAMGDKFCDNPNIFDKTNKALTKLGLGQIEWLPNEGWRKALGCEDGDADRMGDFIAETQALHKMYLDRLKDGLDGAPEELPDITGITELPLEPLSVALKTLGLDKAAETSLKKAEGMDRGILSLEEAAAVHMYTTNHLYKRLNAALRDTDRAKVLAYFKYLRLLLSALLKLPFTTKPLYRGVALDLKAEYEVGKEITWWAVSSCTNDLKVANSFGGGAKQWTLFKITPKKSVGIKQFSEYKHEEEFLLAPGTQFKVVSSTRTGKVIEICMEELDRQCRVR